MWLPLSLVTNLHFPSGALVALPRAFLTGHEGEDW